jgi:hypothetical protein
VSTLHYNSISLEVLETVECSRRIEYDSANSYLWTRWRIHVRAYYNPFATSYTGQPNQEVAEPGSTPALTDETIRHRLSQSRKKLVYTMAGPGAAPGQPPNLNVLGGFGGTLVILDCPPSTFAGGPGGDQPNYTGGPAADQYICDAAWGPTPIALNIRQIAGLKTWRVEYIIEACVNECYLYYSTPAVLLSHRWRMTSDIDRMGFTTRRVSGSCVFRSDVLRQKNLRPDDVRTALFHPIPMNSVRENVVVVAEEDPARYRYSFTDRECSHNLLVRHVARLEAFAHLHRHLPSTTDVAKSFWRPLLGGAKNLLNILGALEGALPGLAVTVTVRAWGTRKASRALLRNVCQRVLMQKLPDPFLGQGGSVPAYSIDAEAIYDLCGRYVEMRATFGAGMPALVGLFLGQDLDEQFPGLIQDDIDGVMVTADTPGRMAVLGNRSHGTSLEACLSQAIHGPCENPPAPFNSNWREADLPIPGVS